MSRNLVRYNDNKNITKFAGRPTRAIQSFIGHALAAVGIAYDDANCWGRIKQIEADMVLEYKLGLPPRQKT